ncbi:hypothetical protein M427DRAFT_52099 [Gonapodya prolifera JEL478]|uniref:Uncharacterized protein n=1 Tax=Gonapodya prolifera (strain JEL478) TaxID=1344416 RepID=A0A139AUT2_GONPJ|nr:hypothetical protein M427DRAFT_52099 [Gonapodya prolifera JEL478]|eukprot:KXS20491.1 hypothetical protein M427DRAFT_52099 [Gonapodya prolifera JEL478]
MRCLRLISSASVVLTLLFCFCFACASATSAELPNKLLTRSNLERREIADWQTCYNPIQSGSGSSYSGCANRKAVCCVAVGDGTKATCRPNGSGCASHIPSYADWQTCYSPIQNGGGGASSNVCANSKSVCCVAVGDGTKATCRPNSSGCASHIPSYADWQTCYSPIQSGGGGASSNVCANSNSVCCVAVGDGTKATCRPYHSGCAPRIPSIADWQTCSFGGGGAANAGCANPKAVCCVAAGDGTKATCRPNASGCR